MDPSSRRPHLFGDIPECGIYRSTDIQAALSLDDWAASSGQWHDELTARGPPPTEQVAAIWTKSVKEQQLQILGQ